MTSPARLEEQQYWAVVMPQLPDTIHDILYVGTAGTTSAEVDMPWLANKHFVTLDVDAQWKPDIVADICATGLPAASYDLIICLQTIEHVYDYRAALAECLRLLRPDGWLVLDCPFSYPYHPDGNFDDYWRMSAEALRRVLRDLGYARIHTHQGKLQSYAWASRATPRFEADIQETSSNNRESHYGSRALRHITAFANLIKADLCDDDICADFGGNDGLCAEQFEGCTGKAVIVVDALASRLRVASEHGLQTLQAELEHLPLADRSIAWGFCANTLEHTWDINLALRELARVCHRGLYLVVPLELRKTDPAHNFSNRNHEWWMEQAGAAGLLVAPVSVKDGELTMFAIHPAAGKYLAAIHSKLVQRGLSDRQI